MQSLGKISIIAVVALAILLNIELADEPLIISQIVTLTGNVSKVFSGVKRSDKLPLLFPWFDDVVPNDDRPWGKGKLLKAESDYKMLGKFHSFIRVIDYKTDSKLEFESDMFLLPRILCTFKEFKSDDQIVLTRLEVKVFSRRLSAFFQWFVRPVLRFFLYYQQRQKFFLLQYGF